MPSAAGSALAGMLKQANVSASVMLMVVSDFMAILLLVNEDANIVPIMYFGKYQNLGKSPRDLNCYAL